MKHRFETPAENLKDLLAQSCRAGMAWLTDLKVQAEELEAELVSQQDMENSVNKLHALISDRLQNAADECNSFRARFEHLESRLNTAMGDTGWTHIYDELRKRDAGAGVEPHQIVLVAPISWFWPNDPAQHHE